MWCLLHYHFSDCISSCCIRTPKNITEWSEDADKFAINVVRLNEKIGPLTSSASGYCSFAYSSLYLYKVQSAFSSQQVEERLRKLLLNNEEKKVVLQTVKLTYTKEKKPESANGARASVTPSGVLALSRSLEESSHPHVGMLRCTDWIPLRIQRCIWYSLLYSLTCSFNAHHVQPYCAHMYLLRCVQFNGYCVICTVAVGRIVSQCTVKPAII
jgi:hypothetical protein